MADDHHGLARISHIVHNFVNDVTASLAQRGGGFVHNQQFRVVIHAFGNLDQLTLLHVVHTGGQRWVDIRDADFFQRLARLEHHGPSVNNRAFFKAFVIA